MQQDTNAERTTIQVIIVSLMPEKAKNFRILAYTPFRVHPQALSHPVLKHQSDTLPKSAKTCGDGVPFTHPINHISPDIQSNHSNTASHSAHTQRLSGTLGVSNPGKPSRDKLWQAGMPSNMQPTTNRYLQSPRVVYLLCSCLRPFTGANLPTIGTILTFPYK